MIGTIVQLRGLASISWIWWCGELTLLFSMVQGLWQSSSLRVIHIDKKGWTVFDDLKARRQKTAYIPNEELEGEIETLPATFNESRRSATIIQLNRHLGLLRPLDLPIAAKADLAQLLHFEIDRLTPFCADEVYLAYHIIDTNETTQQLRVEVAAVPKATIDRAYSIAERHRLPIRRIELEGSRGLDFIRFVQAQDDRPFLFGRFPSMAILVCLVSVLLAFFKIQDQHREIERLDADMLLARNEVSTFLKEREDYEHLAATAEFVEKSKAGKLTMTEILAELTELIPDQAHLVQLIIHRDVIQLYGLADKASSLITYLEQSPVFTEPRFDSPVTIDNNNGRERFHLSVKIAVSSK